MTIELPNLSSIYQPQGGWMITNDYTGSLGTDPMKGCYNREIFCYKVYVIGKADDPSLKAECYIRFAGKDGVKNYNEQEKTAEPTAEGLKSLNEWLDERYEEYASKKA